MWPVYEDGWASGPGHGMQDGGSSPDACEAHEGVGHDVRDGEVACT